MEPKKSHLFKLVPYLMRYKGRVFLSLLLILGARGLSVANPYILKELIDALSENGAFDVGFIGLLVFLFFAFRWGTDLLTGLREYVFAGVLVEIRKHISHDIFQYLLSLPLHFFADQATGGVSRKISRGTQSLSTLSFFLLANVVPTILEIILILIIFSQLFPASFSVVFLVFVVSYILYTIIMTQRRQKILLQQNKEDDSGSVKYVDALMNIETVKYYTNEEYEKTRYNKALTSWAGFAVDSAKRGATLNIGQGFILTVGLTALLGLTVQEFMAGTATVGDFVLVISYIGLVAGPLNFLGTMYRMIKEGLANVDEMFALLDIKNTIVDKSEAKELKIADGHVIFDMVAFHYREDRKILDKLSLEMEGHKSTAIVGYSGSGKSTIAKLIPRLYDIQSGSVRIDGMDVRDVTQESLRQNIGMVAQDTTLFNDTVYYNIAYGNLKASKEEVHQAAELAHIHDFVMSLPDGYDTVVGERGVKLSGGEKQRIAIARMLLKNPPILIFDEATASLDSQSEKMIQNAIKEISHGGKTTIVIAHRLSTIVDFDKIIVMDQGKVVDEGTHEQLLKTSVTYQKLWNIQNREEG